MPEIKKYIDASEFNQGVTEYPVFPEQIPLALKTYPQWVLWRYKPRGEGRKPEKQPISAKTFKAAGVTWSNTWSDFEEVIGAYLGKGKHPAIQVNGIGFVLTHEDPIVAIDLDNCITANGLTPHAEETIFALDSYAEVSPSGHGIRIFVKAEGFKENYKTPNWEVYSHERYVTVTGRQLPGTPLGLMDVPSNLISELLTRSTGNSDSKSLGYPKEHFEADSCGEALQISSSDIEALWQRIFAHDKWGDKHYERFMGNTSFDEGDHSFTVIRLLNALAYYTKCNPALMRAAMLASPLANDKFFAKRPAGDWLDYQIRDAIAYTQGNKKPLKT